MRIAFGLALIAAGVAFRTPLTWSLAAFGLLPLLSGTFDWCPFSPLFGAPFFGRDVRAKRRGG